jgi:2-polyprenyl-3-methyl-5-hydroxy-6-metoxy-1,4-benzoquinol methylase
MHTHEDLFDYESIPPGYYDAVWSRKNGIQSYWHHNKFESIKEALASKTFRSQLDIGCGPGTFVGNYLLAESSIGIDFAGTQIQYANLKYGEKAEFFKASVNQVPSKYGEFDLVTLVELIEHISVEDFKNLLNSLRLRITPQAHIVITTPNYRPPWIFLEWCLNNLARGLKYDQQHITKWNKKSLKEFLKSEGFELVHLGGIQGFAAFVSVISWRLSHRFRVVERNLTNKNGFLILAIAKPKFMASPKYN